MLFMVREMKEGLGQRVWMLKLVMPKKKNGEEIARCSRA